MSQQLYQYAKDSMQENHRVLSRLGKEEKVMLVLHKEEDLISTLSELLPKSTKGKTALLVVAGLIAKELLDSKD